MFKYNWKCLYRCCDYNCDTVMDILTYYAGKKLNKAATKRIYKIAKCNKTAFIFDLKGLINDTTATNSDKCVYLQLASKRNLAEYLFHQDHTLPIELASVEDVDKLNRNPLIEVINNKIYFKY